MSIQLTTTVLGGHLKGECFMVVVVNGGELILGSHNDNKYRIETGREYVLPFPGKEKRENTILEGTCFETITRTETFGVLFKKMLHGNVDETKLLRNIKHDESEEK